MFQTSTNLFSFNLTLSNVFIFKKKSQKDKLQDQHSNLLEETFKMSTVNRTKSDELVAQAAEIERQIEAIKD